MGHRASALDRSAGACGFSLPLITLGSSLAVYEQSFGKGIIIVHKVHACPTRL